MSAAPFGGDTHNQKDHVFGFLRSSFACRTHLIESAVTPSLVAETRKLGYQVYSLFTISNIARGMPPLAKLCDTGQNTPTSQPSLVEPDGIEPTTSCLQSTRSPN